MTLNKFQAVIHETDSAIIVQVGGELDLAAAPELRSLLETVVNRTDKTLILDTERLAYIDSTGIGIVVSVIKARDEKKAEFIVKNIPRSIKRLFDITGISGYINEGTVS
ncbi:STAS domain-containing protein [Paenibacillus sp. KS-LC4]|uniref:STAS domain-containing protein n=1 Tax=Paenibacillus sp. KS-LC4 TaxID=2979727 RepID=UPI0030D349CE